MAPGANVSGYNGSSWHVHLRSRGPIPTEFAVVALCTIVGLLLQIVPCAALCVIPFAGKQNNMAEAWRHVGIILGVSLIPFTALALLPLSDYVRFLTHNFLGFGIIGVLCAYYIRAIEADTSHKTFAFVLAICYGYAVGMVWNFAINTFDLARNPDQTYEVMTLAALLPITVVSFVPMAALMRYVRTLFSTDIDASVWWHMSILPAIPIVALLLGYWLTPEGRGRELTSIVYLTTVAIVIVVRWTLRTIETLQESTLRQNALEGALTRSAEQRSELARKLRTAAGRVRELEAEIAEASTAAAEQRERPSSSRRQRRRRAFSLPTCAMSSRSSASASCTLWKESPFT